MSGTVIYIKHLFLFPRKGERIYFVHKSTNDITVRRIILPIYDLKCTHCGEVHEKLVRHSDDLTTFVCPHCLKKGVEKIITGTKSFRLYGEGFHKRTHKDTGDWS